LQFGGGGVWDQASMRGAWEWVTRLRAFQDVTIIYQRNFQRDCGF